MKNLILISFLIIGLFGQSQNISIVSWNIRDMGKTKDSSEIAFMANTLKNYDIVAIQEVVTSDYGKESVSSLVSEMNKILGCGCWKYSLSNKTGGSGTEKYAFLYNLVNIDFVKATLVKSLNSKIVREPYVGTFAVENDTFSIVNFHAVPESRNPEKEITTIASIDTMTSRPLIFLGDFNHPQYESGFDLLKSYCYAPSLIGKKTSIKTKIDENGEYFSKEFDNFFYDVTYFKVIDSYVIDFTLKFSDLSLARNISDHCPIVITIKL